MTPKSRSIDQHRRFFALIAAAYSHWPEAHAFQPESAEHLRAWLLVKAKHCTIQTFCLSEQADEIACLLPVITASMLGRHSWCRAEGRTLHVCVPVSINFATVGHQEFTVISNAVDEVIRVETGLDPEHLMREAA